MDYAFEYNGHNATGMRTHTVADADAVTARVTGNGNGSDSRILVFRTSLQTASEVQLLAAHLDGRKGIKNWFVDLDDRDKVLRIETDCLMPHDVICTLTELNIRCRPL